MDCRSTIAKTATLQCLARRVTSAMALCVVLSEAGAETPPQYFDAVAAAEISGRKLDAAARKPASVSEATIEGARARINDFCDSSYTVVPLDATGSTIYFIRHSSKPLLLAPLLTGSDCRADELVYITDFGEQPPRVFAENESNYARQNLDEYARSSGLPVLKDGDGDQIRVWVTVANFNVRTIGYDTVGYVVSGGGVRACRIT